MGEGIDAVFDELTLWRTDHLRGADVVYKVPHEAASDEQSFARLG